MAELRVSSVEEIVPRCELSGKGPVVKKRVSHSNHKTKFRAQPNIQSKQLYSAALNEYVRLNLAVGTLRSIEHMGGLDPYLLRQPENLMSKRALAVRGRVKAKLSNGPKTPKESGR